jgi:ribosomal protein L39E
MRTADCAKQNMRLPCWVFDKESARNTRSPMA